MSSIESKGQEIPAEELERIYKEADDFLELEKSKGLPAKDWIRTAGAYCAGKISEYLRAHSSQPDDKKIHPVYKGWDSLRLIGRVKDRFQELIRKGWDWTGFYHGWLEGRAEMLDEMKKDWDASALQHVKEPAVEMEKTIPKMSDQLAAESDMAALDYGRVCDRFIGSRHYDSSHITEAHEQGQLWMYRKLSSPPSIQQEPLKTKLEDTLQWMSMQAAKNMCNAADSDERSYYEAYLDALVELRKEMEITEPASVQQEAIPDQPSNEVAGNEGPWVAVPTENPGEMAYIKMPLAASPEQPEGLQQDFHPEYVEFLSLIRDISKDQSLKIADFIERQNLKIAKIRDEKIVSLQSELSALREEKNRLEFQLSAERECVKELGEHIHMLNSSSTLTPPIKPDPPYVLPSDGPASTVLADALDHFYDGFNITMLGEHEPRIRRLLNELVEGLRQVDRSAVKREKKIAIGFYQWLTGKHGIVDGYSVPNFYDLYLQSLARKAQDK